MSRRLSLAARGPGALAAVLVAVIIVALVTHHTNQTVQRQAGAHVISPQTTLTSKTTRTDTATGMKASIEEVVALPARATPRPSHIILLFQVVLHNGGRRPQPVTPVSFYALSPSGATYATGCVPAGLHALRSYRLPRGRITTGWIAFRVPLPTPPLTVLWNDANRLLPPGNLARVSVREKSP